MKLKKQEGSFELWTQGTNRAVIVAANGKGEPHRTTVELLQISGLYAVRDATRTFDDLVAAMRFSK